MKKIITILLLMALTGMLHANNITTSNLSLTGKNTTDHFTLVQFDISWENSWRTSSAPNNWDAAWVFVKYRVGSGDWQHAWLNNAGHTAPAGSAITPGLLTPGTAFNATTNPVLGAFFYRSDDGAASTFAKTGVQLRWNYGANGVADGDQVEIKVFAIEMVYVPQGAFTVGSGGTESGSFTDGSWTSGASVPLSISSESELTIAQSAGNLWGTSVSGDNTIGSAGTLATAFPKGCGAFYCQKYEITQQQYVDFLNTLTQTQANVRKFDKPETNHRYEITGNTVGSYTTSNPYVVCNYLSWMDGAAYSDWAGLRPMTELEYERACRGTATPLTDEYAWGTAPATAATNITNPGASNETTSTSGANAVFNYNVQGPMRVGVFATGSTTREQSGASYYGIMEMSGNLLERAVSVATGRTFTGLHGNGAINSGGHADVTAWPGLTGGEVTEATGSGSRGGDWGFGTANMCVSERNLAAKTVTNRITFYGFRAVRTQPLAIGDLYQGGIVAYILQPGDPGYDAGIQKGLIAEPGDPGYDAGIQKGLIAAPSEQSTSAGWGCSGTAISGADGTAIGTGNQNTIDIEAGCTTAGIAADICANLTLGGYSDWYLPSKDELYKLYINKRAVGGFASGSYWSSSEYNSGTAWEQYFGFGDQNNSSKSDTYRVRAVRAFPTLPTVTTTSAASITSTTATSGGDVTNAGDYPITTRGVCWSTTTGPTTALATKTTNGSGTGVFTSNLTSLTASTLYYVRAYATSSAGTTYGNEVSFTTAAPPLAIGDSYQGGIVAYILQPGDPGYDAGIQKGLIAAPSDHSTKAGWGCNGTTISGADGTAIGTGNQNTVDIEAGCTTAGIAADICANLTLGGYSDWYLPSKDELNKLYINRVAVGGFDTTAFYWSSSESTPNYAWRWYFLDGNAYSYSKSNAHYVRAVRAFPTLPSVSTTAATSITATTATSGGDVTNAGDYPITARGVCWSTTTGPTTALATKTTDGSGTGVFTSNLTSLTASTLYYVRAYATNSAGTSYGNEVSFTTAAPPLAIGDSYQGGKVAYILQPGDPGYVPGGIHGLIAAPSNQSTSAEWGCMGTEIIGADGTAIGTGNQNTIDIEVGCTTADIAADICANLTLGGYSDWYLPSKDELNKLYINRLAVGGFTSANYWSSSESNDYGAWSQYFGNGSQDDYDKTNPNYVRAVRAF